MGLEALAENMDLAVEEIEAFPGWLLISNGLDSKDVLGIYDYGQGQGSELQYVCSGDYTIRELFQLGGGPGPDLVGTYAEECECISQQLAFIEGMLQSMLQYA